jgi:hypothetical protein
VVPVARVVPVAWVVRAEPAGRVLRVQMRRPRVARVVPAAWVWPVVRVVAAAMPVPVARAGSSVRRVRSG